MPYAIRMLVLIVHVHGEYCTFTVLSAQIFSMDKRVDLWLFFGDIRLLSLKNIILSYIWNIFSRLTTLNELADLKDIGIDIPQKTKPKCHKTMDEEKSGILKCFIYKFKQHVDLSSVSETYLCVRCRLLALVHNDCTLQLVHLDPKINTGVPSLQNIKRLVLEQLCIHYT